MSRYLLDTNTVSALIKSPQGRVTQKISEIGAACICTSVVVAAELRFGVAKRGARTLGRKVDAVLASMEILGLEPPVDHFYADLRQHLQKSGTTIGANDLWIAAQCLALGLDVVTQNGREFKRVPGLKVHDWVTMDDT